MTPNDALIFDVDGTLWNACSASAKGWNIGLAKLGIDRHITAADVEGVAGQPYEACIDILFPGFQERYPTLLDTLSACEIDVIKSEGGRFYEGVIDGIQTLAHSYKIFLVSNCQEWYMELFLRFSGLEPVLTGLDCHGLSQLPKSEMLARLTAQHSLHCPVYIGDTQGDETAAHLAKMDFIHAAYGFGSPAHEARHFDSFAELVESFGGC